MRTEYDNALIRDLFKLVDEHRAAGTQIIDHKAIVHDLMAHINRRAKHFQGPVDDINCAIDARTEAPGIRQLNLH